MTTATIPTREPTVLTQGDSWQWDRVITAYPPSDGWQLSYTVRGPKDLDLDWGTEVTADGDTFQVRVPAATTAPDAGPGLHVLTGYVTKGADRFTVYRENLQVAPDPSTAVDTEDPTKALLDAIDAALAGQALTADQQALTINGRSISRFSVDELSRYRNRIALRYETRRNPGGRLLHAARFRTQ